RESLQHRLCGIQRSAIDSHFSIGRRAWSPSAITHPGGTVALAGGTITHTHAGGTVARAGTAARASAIARAGSTAHAGAAAHAGATAHAGPTSDTSTTHVGAVRLAHVADVRAGAERPASGDGGRRPPRGAVSNSANTECSLERRPESRGKSRPGTV